MRFRRPRWTWRRTSVTWLTSQKMAFYSFRRVMPAFMDTSACVSVCLDSWRTYLMYLVCICYNSFNSFSCIHQSIRPFFRLFISIHQSICLSVHPSVHPHIHQSIRLSVYVSVLIHPAIHPSVLPPVHIHWSVPPSLFIHPPFIYLFEAKQNRWCGKHDKATLKSKATPHKF